MQERDFPYIYCTWLSPLLSGDASCEYAVWFKAHYQNYPKVTREFDSARWNQEHTELLNQMVADTDGRDFWLEGQNKFNMRGSSATLGGKADLVVANPDGSMVVQDAKTGQQKDRDITQVQIYMWALPLAISRYKGIKMDGQLVYKSGQTIDIPASSITPAFTNGLTDLIKRIAGPLERPAMPSFAECRYCELSKEACKYRVESDTQTVITEAF